MKIKNIIEKSFAAKMVLPPLLILVVSLFLTGLLNVHYSYSHLKKLTFQKLKHEIDLETAGIEEEIEDLSQDTIFLSSVPPIKGLLRANLNNNKDPLSGASSEQWKLRLETIFTELMHSKEEYLQIRYIGFKNNGKELVRVNRGGEKVYAVKTENLQHKDKEPYFYDLTKIHSKKVYLSPLTYNREFGKVQEPRKLVIRAAIPVFTKQKKPFGFVIINMLTDELFSSVYSLRELSKHIQITDDQNTFFPHPKDRSIVKKKLPSFHKEINYKKIASSNDSKNITMKELKNSFVVTKKIFYDKNQPQKYFNILVATSNKNIYEMIWSKQLIQALFSFLLILTSLLLTYYYFKKQSAPLNTLESLAQDFAKDHTKTIPYTPIHLRKDEVGDLARALSKMSLEIETQTAMLNLHKKALDRTALVSETDAQGRITYANTKFSTVSHYSNKELLGSDHRIVNSGFHSREFFVDMWKTISSGKTWRGEIRNKKKNKEFYWVDTTIVPFLDNKGKIKRYISIRLDITAQKKQAAQIKELSDSRSRFFSTISHEIRNPLGAIIGVNELLSLTSLDPQQKDYVDTINESSSSLLLIMNDILDYSKLSAGKFNIAPEPTNLEQILKSVHKLFLNQALKKNLSFHYSLTKETPKFFLIDCMRFKQILNNLISNAIKFTAKGSISITVSSQKKEGTNHSLKISIQDTGIGMTEDQKKIIFSEYQQADSSVAKKFGGTGLGLSICKKLVEAMHGSIVVESTPNVGSTFIATIEAKETTEQALEQKTIKNKDITTTQFRQDKPSILLAEDNKINQELFRAMIKIFDLEVTIVDNGAEALKQVKEKDFSLIFLDLQMPTMGGKMACQEILQYYTNQNKEAPWLVALTANSFAEDKLSCFSCGFNDFLGKPYRKKDLGQALQNYINRKKRNKEPKS